jgi:DNA primase
MNKTLFLGKQFLVDLYVYADFELDEIENIGSKFLSEEDLDEVLNYLKILDEEYKRWKEEQDNSNKKNDIQILVEYFPDLMNNPEYILDTLRENLKDFVQQKEALDVFLWEHIKELEEAKKRGEPFWNEFSKRYNFLIERIETLSSLIEFLETYKKVPEKTDFTEERENFRNKVRKVLSLDIDRVIENEFGVKISHQEPAMIRCQLPNHNDKEPSFAVYRRTNSFYCFGCQRGGDVISFIKHLFNFNFIEAVNYLYQNYV